MCITCPTALFRRNLGIKKTAAVSVNRINATTRFVKITVTIPHLLAGNPLTKNRIIEGHGVNLSDEVKPFCRINSRLPGGSFPGRSLRKFPGDIERATGPDRVWHYQGLEASFSRPAGGRL
jgi:hypothetical protein